MILGIVGGCLGVVRDDEKGHVELERCLGVVTRTDAQGALLVDYHTAQAPKKAADLRGFAKREGRLPSTRKDELAANHEKNTALSMRQYRVDAAFAVCLWLREESSSWSLESIADHMRRPKFVPFAGRKGAPIGLPFEPSFVEADDPVAALRSLRFSLDDEIEKLVLSQCADRTYRWDGDSGRWQDLKRDRTEVRRDRVASRLRWQFLLREEHVFTERKEGSLVPERH